jgi:hypothetical protein
MALLPEVSERVHDASAVIQAFPERPDVSPEQLEEFQNRLTAATDDIDKIVTWSRSFILDQMHFQDEIQSLGFRLNRLYNHSSRIVSTP